jgi:hypothetical protein
MPRWFLCPGANSSFYEYSPYCKRVGKQSQYKFTALTKLAMGLNVEEDGADKDGQMSECEISPGNKMPSVHRST